MDKMSWNCEVAQGLRHPEFRDQSRVFVSPQQPTLLMPEPHPIHQPPPPPPTDPNPVASTAANARRNPAPLPLPLPLPEIAVPPVQPKMIIKGMLGRYERWNPVHPTAGAFWGVGLGFGCGVGWGPGFGPEVIGYVGAGCGVGFSVGITLAGVGIGLPQNGIIKNHYYGSGFANNVPFESARFYTLTLLRGMLWDAMSYMSNVAAMRKESRQKLLRSQENPRVSGGVDLPKLGKGMSSSFGSTMECIKAFTNQNWPP